MFSKIARDGLTFYLVRALFCYWVGEDANAQMWADRGIKMLKGLKEDPPFDWRNYCALMKGKKP